MYDFQAIQVTMEKQVAWLTLNRPEARNAINEKMREELLAVLNDARTNTDVRALVLTGKGRVFGAGLDLGEASTFDRPALADHAVEQRRLADVGAPNDGDHWPASDGGRLGQGRSQRHLWMLTTICCGSLETTCTLSGTLTVGVST